MSNLQNAQPQLSPNDPAYIALNKQEALDRELADNLAGTVMINNEVKAEPTYTKVKVHPYIVGGKKKIVEYNVFYKNVSYCVKANSLLEAVQEGYVKLVNNIPNFTKKKIKIGVQRKNKNRENHIYYYLVKKESIKNPKYKSKITFVKL